MCTRNIKLGKFELEVINMTISETKLLSVKDIQTNLGISSQNAYAIFHRRDFPLIKLGSRLYVRQDAFLKWLGKIEKINERR